MAGGNKTMRLISWGLLGLLAVSGCDKDESGVAGGEGGSAVYCRLRKPKDCQNGCRLVNGTCVENHGTGDCVHATQAKCEVVKNDKGESLCGWDATVPNASTTGACYNLQPGYEPIPGAPKDRGFFCGLKRESPNKLCADLVKEGDEAKKKEQCEKVLGCKYQGPVCSMDKKKMDASKLCEMAEVSSMGVTSGDACKAFKVAGESCFWTAIDGGIHNKDLNGNHIVCHPSSPDIDFCKKAFEKASDKTKNTCESQLKPDSVHKSAAYFREANGTNETDKLKTFDFCQFKESQCVFDTAGSGFLEDSCALHGTKKACESEDKAPCEWKEGKLYNKNAEGVKESGANSNK